MRDNNALFCGICAESFDILGKSKADAHNGVNIHSANTRAENTAHTARAEFKLGGKTLGNSLLIILYSNQFCLDIGRKTLKIKPTIKVIHILFGRHKDLLLKNNTLILYYI